MHKNPPFSDGGFKFAEKVPFCELRRPMSDFFKNERTDLISALFSFIYMSALYQRLLRSMQTTINFPSRSYI